MCTSERTIRLVRICIFLHSYMCCLPCIEETVPFIVCCALLLVLTHLLGLLFTSLFTALADRARNLDGGVFAESLNSLNGNNNFATSFFNSSGEANPVTGDRRRYCIVLCCVSLCCVSWYEVVNSFDHLHSQFMHNFYITLLCL